MKSLITSFLIVLLAGTSAFCQSTQSGLKFTQGQGLEVTMNLKTTIAQEAMGQSVDFTIDGLATHLFKVTNTTPDNTTLHHTMKRISYTFDGMGQKQPFDSDKQKDMEGQFNLTIFLNNLAKEEERLVSLTPGVSISDVNTGKVNILNDIIEALEPAPVVEAPVEAPAEEVQG